MIIYTLMNQPVARFTTDQGLRPNHVWYTLFINKNFLDACNHGKREKESYAILGEDRRTAVSTTIATAIRPAPTANLASAPSPTENTSKNPGFQHPLEGYIILYRRDSRVVLGRTRSRESDSGIQGITRRDLSNYISSYHKSFNLFKGPYIVYVMGGPVRFLAWAGSWRTLLFKLRLVGSRSSSKRYWSYLSFYWAQNVSNRIKELEQELSVLVKLPRSADHNQKSPTSTEYCLSRNGEHLIVVERKALTEEREIPPR